MYIKNFTKVMDDALDIVHARKGEMMLSDLLMGLLAGGIFFVCVIGVAIAVAVASIGGGVGIAIVACIAGLLLTFLGMTLMGIAQGSIMVLAENHYHEHQKIAGPNAIGRAMKRLPALMGLAVFEIIGAIPIIILVILCLGGTGFLIGKMVDNSYALMSQPAGTIFLFYVLVLLMLAMWIFIGAMYMAVFGLCVPAIVVDGLGPVAALKKSFALVRGEYWRMVKKMLLLQLGLIGVTICFNSVLGLLGVVLGLMAAFTNDVSLSILQVVTMMVEWPVRILFNLLFFAISPTVIYILYYNQKCKKEGEDLRRRVYYVRRHEENKWRSGEAEFSKIDLAKRM